jgi:hypothetical protein
MVDAPIGSSGWSTSPLWHVDAVTGGGVHPIGLRYFFHVETNNSRIGERAIAGYPVDAVRKARDGAQSTLSKRASVIGQYDALEIDDQARANDQEGLERRRGLEV